MSKEREKKKKRYPVEREKERKDPRQGAKVRGVR